LYYIDEANDLKIKWYNNFIRNHATLKLHKLIYIK
jgi:hypothetical protein